MNINMFHLKYTPVAIDPRKLKELGDTELFIIILNRDQKSALSSSVI